MTSTMRFDKWENSLGQPYGTVLQVVSVTKTDVFSTSSTTYTDITGLSVSITPKSVSSKLLISWGINFSNTATNGVVHMVLTDGSNNTLVQGNADGAKTRVTEGMRQLPTPGANTMEMIMNASNSFLYSPATTSSVTIKFRIKTSTGNAVINRNGVFFNDADNALPVSSLTIMEIAQ